ncbi:uncharacterized protein C2845_PM03G05480 [Panicum miliaceum]|uniref:Uncharacterized protein n=1 Tax=Panicum miliaceum TaxID=4540 RepID=A0A3L6T931_PANMI|nr:uncharacterized protein C2845_PM03G05480 [Panicum miliaceum]
MASRGSPYTPTQRRRSRRRGSKNQTKVWAILNALRNHGVNLHIDDEGPQAARLKQSSVHQFVP